MQRPAEVTTADSKSQRGSRAEWEGQLTGISEEIFQNLKGKKILVADDIKDLQVMSSLFLKRAGANVEIACDGADVVEKALNGQHDAILMDVHMPKMDGLAATEYLRSMGYKKPIIILTADYRIGVIEKAFDIGANSCLSKPVSWIDMLHLLDRVCKRGFIQPGEVQIH